jgi:hypothetical protein
VFGGHEFFYLGVFGNQRRIRRLTIEKAKELPDALSFLGISTVEQYLGFGASHRSALSLVSTDDGKRECALPVPTRGGTPTLAYRSKRTGRRGRINAA